MPAKPKRPCAVAGCRNLADRGYCQEHKMFAHKLRRERNKQYDLHQRDRKAKDFYHSEEWEAVRNEALQRDYGLCQDCKQEQRITQADVVDHIKPIHPFWDLRLRLDNLRSLCHAHHNKKTAEDRRRYGGRVKNL
ncbi:HNH endonuclease [Brevibacillus sp. MER 51]|nr:HNH endonuclease [Brevibacillus sp. MER 51]